MKAPRAAGFSLVEILIVVLILGILAMVALPAIVTSPLEAKEAALVANLTSLRKAIELYYLQHDSTYPGITQAAVIRQLTQKTDRDGDAGSDFGPYLNQIPLNGLNNKRTILIVLNYTPPTNATGWIYNRKTGKIYPNSSGATLGGINYADL